VFGAESIYFRLDFQFRILKSDQAHSSVTSLSFPPVPHVSHPTANPRSHTSAILSVSFLHYCRTPRLLCFSCCCRYAALLPPFAACQLLVAVRARTSHSSACLAIKTEPPTPRHLCFFFEEPRHLCCAHCARHRPPGPMDCSMWAKIGPMAS
jgi:hypothetical protein